LAVDGLGPFSFGKLGERVVLSNDAGDWALLDPADFRLLLAGELGEDHPRFEELRDKAFIRRRLDLDALADRVGRKKAFVGVGPHLHIVITSLRCNQGCRYCHASRVPMDRPRVDMTAETAVAVVDHAMRTTSPNVVFEFTGGEPPAHMAALKTVVELARERHRVENKTLEFTVVSNFTHMTEENAEWLVDNDFMVCTSLDGPRDLHDLNRPWTGGSAFDSVVHWMDWFNQRWIDVGRDPELWHVDALLTVTRETLGRVDDILDLYVERGLRSIHLRPLHPAGFAKPNWERIGYPVEEFIAFRRQALERILALNLAGTHLQEALTAIVLEKMLTPGDPNYVDLRSPCGAGSGQVTYDHDGSLFPCDEARMIGATGDRTFELGQVVGTTAEQTAQHPTVKTLALASLTESLPGCSTCWNRPFCGVCPMVNYMASGDIFDQRPRSAWCHRQMDLSKWILGKLDNDEDGKVEQIFRRWLTRRPRA